MRGLALKIFLSFWLIHAVLFAIFALTPNEGPDGRLADHIAHDAAVAAAIFEAQGPEACAAFATAAGTRTGLWIRLNDSGGALACAPAAAAPAASSVTAPAVQIVTTTPRGQSLAVSATADATFAQRLRGGPPYRTAVLLIVVSGLVCFGLAGYLSRPLREMREVATRLAGGDLQARVGAKVTRRNDEIGDLVGDFDTMATRLEALVNAQRQLLSDISHELRSPLARLHVALELARRKAGSGAEIDLDRIESEADRMNDLIGRMLALARAEHTDEQVSRPVQLAGVVRHVAEDADYEAQQAQKAVTVTIDADVIVPGDPELVASAIDNVIRNAVRHTHTGTAVDVEVTSTGREAVVTVRDHGAGVPDSELERIFTPFHRLDAARNRDAGGVGLGLSIARRTMAVHGGQIVAENAPGGGLLVTLRFPLSTAALLGTPSATR